MSTKAWIGVGVGALVALTVAGVVWALRAGPPSSVATSSASSGPVSGPGATTAQVDPSRGPATQAPSAGEKASDFFSSGLALLEGARTAGSG